MTADRPLHRLGALALAAGYASRRFTPLDVLGAIHDRIDAVNPEINAIIAEDREAARLQARHATERWSADAPLSPLDGVPVTIKDNLHVAGLPAGWGSVLHDDGAERSDEPALVRLRAAGMIFVGKTNVPEFTLQGYTDNAVHGATRNPLAPALTPGGSTGGGAAAVAAGLCPVAIGTDGGGSTRRPAAHCGLFGFKPSIGQIARSGGFPQILADFEVIGVIAREARDLGPVHALMAAADALDPRTLATHTPHRAFGAAPRIGCFTGAGDAPVDPAIAAATEDFAVRLAAQGCHVERIGAPYSPAQVDAAFAVIAQAGLAWHLSRHPGADGRLGANARQMGEAGRRLSAVDYAGAMADCLEIRGRGGAILEEFDMLLSPTTAALAWPAHDPYPPVIAGREAGPRGHSLFTTWVNVAGLCAASLPVEITPDRGGMGVQLIAGHGRDRALLDFVAALPAMPAPRSPDPGKARP